MALLVLVDRRGESIYENFCFLSDIRNALFEFRQGLIVELNGRKKRERRKKIRLRLNIRRKIFANICRSVVGREIVSWPIESISNLESRGGKRRNIPVALRMTLMFDTWFLLGLLLDQQLSVVRFIDCWRAKSI